MTLHYIDNICLRSAGTWKLSITRRHSSIFHTHSNHFLDLPVIVHYRSRFAWFIAYERTLFRTSHGFSWFTSIALSWFWRTCSWFWRASSLLLSSVEIHFCIVSGDTSPEAGPEDSEGTSVENRLVKIFPLLVTWLVTFPLVNKNINNT